MIPVRRALLTLKLPSASAGIPALAALKDRLPNLSARYNRNFVLARPKWRVLRTSSYTNRASLCFTTTCRSRYPAQASLCRQARACCNGASCGCDCTDLLSPDNSAAYWDLSGKTLQTTPSNRKPFSW